MYLHSENTVNIDTQIQLYTHSHTIGDNKSNDLKEKIEEMVGDENMVFKESKFICYFHG